MHNQDIIGLTIAELFVVLFLSVLILFPYAFESDIPEPIIQKEDQFLTVIIQKEIQSLPKIIQKEVQSLPELLDKLELILKEKNLEIIKLKEEIEKLNKELSILRKKPIIVLYDTDFRFKEGSADITPFKKKLESNILPEVHKNLNTLSKFGINTIEIVGHTDGQITSRKISNFDILLENVVLGLEDLNKLQFGSNVDLGLLRAISIYLFLKKNLQIEDINYRVYSAAQLIQPNGKIINEINRNSVGKYRRIEIRFTKTDSNKNDFGKNLNKKKILKRKSNIK